MMRRTRVLIASGLAAMMLVVPVRATVAVPTDLADVVSTATLIVRGRVVDTRAFTDVANGPVTTAVTVAITEVLKGRAESTVTFRVHGGELGRYRHVMIGSPVFATGEVAYLFLKRAPDGALWTVGLGAGVYRVSSGSGSPGALVVNPPVVAGVTATTGAPVVRGDSRRKPMSVSDFSGVVRLLMAREPGGAERTGRPGRSGRAGGGR